MNKSTWKGGLPWQLWLACICVSGAVMAQIDFLFGAFLFVASPAALIWLFKKDEQIVALANLSVVQKSYYDPGKVQR
jgi:hypothetical protein